MKLKYARKEVVNLIVTKNTPSLFDAEYYCDTRPLTKKFTKKNKNFKKTVNSLKKSCALLQQAKKLIKKQGIISPRPVEYFSNLAALRITIDAIIIGEKGWRKYEE